MKAKKKEKRDILFEVWVKPTDGETKILKRFIELEIEWRGSESVNFETVIERNKVISLGRGKNFNYRFLLKKLKLKKGWFKDKAIDWELEPIQDEISEKIIYAWGDKVTPSQTRWGNVALTAFAVFALLLFLFGAFFWLKKKAKRQRRQ